MNKELRLSLKKEWFIATAVNGKTEDYREINDYWKKRLTVQPKDIDWSTSKEICDEIVSNYNNKSNKLVFKRFDTNIMTLGYPSKNDSSRIIKFKHEGIEIRTGREEWGAEPNKLYFVIKHGLRLE